MSARRGARRLYAAALRAFPPRHRHAYAAEMVDAFERELELRRNAGGMAAIRFVAAASINAIGAGIGERQRHRVAAHMSQSWLSSLDVILAWRMLIRYPGLSIVGVFGMAIGMAVAAGAFTVTTALTDAALPLPGGDRLVSLMTWDTATNNREGRVLADFVSWREMSALEDVSVTRTVERTLIVSNAIPESVTVAEIPSAGFRIAGVAALRGRHLLPEDDRAGGPAVLVIGHDEWLQRFHADPDIVGREVRLGDTAYTVVGVMPEGYGFPVNHSFWIPWRLEPSVYEPRTGPSVSVFARLRPEASLESAQVEIDAIAQRMAVAWPRTHEHLRPRVVPYTYAFNVMGEPGNAIGLQVMQAAIVLLLIVVCVNVSILVYARTATRQGEISVRSALGASRRRIVMQLFVEALILAGVAAAAGIGILAWALARLEAALLPVAGRLPFWMTFELSTDGLIYIVALTLLCAAIVGVAPALKATGRNVQARLQSLSAGSGSRMQMGRVWTLLIVGQVALTVALLPSTMYHAWTSLRFRTGNAGFASQEFLTARVMLDRAASAPESPSGERAFRSRYATAQVELDRRLRREPGVSAVTFSMVHPGEELAVVLEAEGQPPPLNPVNYNIVEGTKQGHLVRFNRVAVNFFEAFDVPVLIGREFSAADTGAGGARGVVVNRALADSLFGKASPLGHRIRYVGRSREAAARDVVLERWYEIVGVVPDFPTSRTLDVDRVSRVYHAAAPGDVYPAALAVRVRGTTPENFSGAFRQLSASVDPNLQMQDLSSADAALKREQGLMRLIGVTIIAVMSSVIILAAAGIYALMSFTVARRRREIGIRSALGADPARVLAGIFSRALGQVGVGAALGLVGACALEMMLEGAMFQGQGAVIVPIVIGFMTLVGMLAVAGPARRGLRIQPIEALREE
jgi:predicted permease